jgi:predicted Zn-dependent peptidase
MRQAEVIMLSQSSRFNKEWLPYIRLYNDYYGSGLSSIMFQEVREKMALAYAVSSSFGVPNYKDDSHYITSYVGTQVDKLETALNKMDNLLGNMVEVPKQFDGAKSSIVRNLESDWVTGEGVFGLYDQALKRGLTTDVRKEVYSSIKQLNINNLKTFFDTNVKGRARVYLVIGNKDKINFDLLKKTGEVKELPLEEVFGY